MLIVKIAAESNGAHANQTINGAMSNIPEGWAVIPVQLEEDAYGALPWLELSMENGQILAVSENAAAKEAWEASMAMPQETVAEGSSENSVEVN